MKVQMKNAFTLVELLVVIAIMGILIALLLPAIQAAREVARSMQCKNNLKQIGLGCTTHLNAQGHYPTGGWGWKWAGDPDRGYGKQQPGGLFFNILPYIEMRSIHDMGLGNITAGRGATTQSAISIYNCPSRRPAILYFYDGTDVTNQIVNIPKVKSFVGRSDYAANAGDIFEFPTGGPGSEQYEDILANVFVAFSGQYPNETAAGYPPGMVYAQSMVKLKDVADGTSHTMIVGERYLDPDSYYTGTYFADDQTWGIGYDVDVNRWTADNHVASDRFAPIRDRRGFADAIRFGSAHPSTFNTVFADGSVHTVSYNITPEILRRLSTPRDRDLNKATIPDTTDLN
ncbi:MAG TPA: DUF1559 domain-containing protein [Thermoguttaceae bacterium]